MACCVIEKENSMEYVQECAQMKKQKKYNPKYSKKKRTCSHCVMSFCRSFKAGGKKGGESKQLVNKAVSMSDV